MAFLLHQPTPMVSCATGFHHPLDRLDLLLYISRECPGIEPLAPIYSADLDTLGNLVNGLGQINRYAFHRTSPSEQSPRCYRRNVVRGESITAFKSFASLW
jgi:hypothetical protein